MFNMKTGSIFGALLTVGTLIASLLGGGGQQGYATPESSQQASAYSDIAIMKSVCTLAPDEEAAVNSTLASLMETMSESEINLGRSLTGTLSLTLNTEADKARACEDGFRKMADLP